MPNGFHGSREDWERMESPLLEIDESLKDFAQAHTMELSLNYHAWPSRRLTWGVDIHRLIEISLEDEREMTFNFWICAWKDGRRKRYWKNAYLREGAPFPEIKEELRQLLQEGIETLESWHKKDLRSSTR
jgi:hypothetical protein